MSRSARHLVVGVCGSVSDHIVANTPWVVVCRRQVCLRDMIRSALRLRSPCRIAAVRCYSAPVAPPGDGAQAQETPPPKKMTETVRLGGGKKKKRPKIHPALRPPKPRVTSVPSRTTLLIRERAAALAEEEKKAQESKLPWQIVGAALIERLPLIMKDPPDWEADFEKVQQELSQLGKVFPPEVNVMGEGPQYTMDEADVIAGLPFKLAPRVTKADRLNDRTTLNRALADRVFLLVKDNKDGLWRLPMVTWDGKSKMRPAHEKLIRDYMGEKFEFYVPSNAPIGFHWRVHDEAHQKETGTYGSKIFVYRSQHVRGRGRVLSPRATEFVWVTSEEMPEYFKHDEAYAALLGYIM